MARYIDADRLRDRVKIQTNPYGKPTLEYASGLKVLTMIDQEPTADVIERDRLNKIISETYDKYVFGSNDLEAEEKDAIIDFCDDITYQLDNLLKEPDYEEE